MTRRRFAVLCQYMDAVQRIQEILGQADRSLAELAAQLLASRDFDGATAAVDAARRLSTLLTAEPRSSKESPEPAFGLRPEVHADNAGVKTATGAKPSRVRKGDYPRFIREGDTLIKIGWSKSEKAEYEHKSPKKVLDHIVPAISKVGAGGKRFAMDKVLPLKDPEGGEIPDYQAYLCLAWLRVAGAVVQHGRQGYSVSKGAPLAAAVDSAWLKLTHRE